MIRPSVIAYWLIPSEPAHSFFQGIINDLARRYDAPAFEPHVTVYVGADRMNAAEEALADAARQCKPIGLIPLGVDDSDVFIKTLFVRFAMSAELRRLNALIRRGANDSSPYGLKPHLSLIYKKMASTVRREIGASIAVPFSDVTFGSMKAVRCVSPTQLRADVEAWRIVAAISLVAD